ncbi:MAG: aminopeptidase [Deltaproteobacteria bacterium]|nr:MAG: aminopeptidase [Deltaproteobacteria bacterium]
MVRQKEEIDFEQALTRLLVECMGLRKGESCLVLCDTGRKGLGASFCEAAKHITSGAKLSLVQPPGRKGWPPDTLARLENEMATQDVILLLTGQSLSHTDARRRAVKGGARLASMPGITKEMLLRAGRADYQQISKKSKRLREILTDAHVVSVKTGLGTAINFSVRGMEGHMEDGLYNREGTWGNMPAGEACIGPEEGTAEGVILVDWSMSTIGRLEEPLHIRVERGCAVELKGKEAHRLLERLSPFGRSAFTVAEFAMGTNEWAQLSGVVLEDEKVFGTAHFALGNNISFGGTTDVPIHLDGVLRAPTVTVDGRCIMEQGHLL